MKRCRRTTKVEVLEIELEKRRLRNFEESQWNHGQLHNRLIASGHGVFIRSHGGEIKRSIMKAVILIATNCMLEQRENMKRNYTRNVKTEERKKGPLIPIFSLDSRGHDNEGRIFRRTLRTVGNLREIAYRRREIDRTSTENYKRYSYQNRPL